MAKRQSKLFVDGVMSKPGSGLANIARRLLAAKPLDYLEKSELYRLRQCNLQVPTTTFASEREELDALRAELQRELAEVRTLTEKEWPLSYEVEPVAELYWRRPLAESKRKAAEAATEEKARKRREADELRLAGLRAQKDAEKRAEEAAEEEARLKRQHEEEQRTWARQRRQDEEHKAAAAAEEEARLKRQREEEQRQKRENDKRIADQSHLTLNEREREVQERLRRNWTEGGALTGPEQEAWPPIYRCEGDCGRPHATQTAAAACEIVRRPARTPAPTRPTPTSSAPARPSPTSSAPARPSPSSAPARPSPTSSAPARPSPSSARPSPTSSAPARPSPTSSAAARPSPTSSAPRPSPTSSAPRPSPTRPTTTTPERVHAPARPGVSHLQLVPQAPAAVLEHDQPTPLERRILDAVASKSLGSYRAILAEVGGKRATALAAIQAMHEDGRIRLDGGIFRPGK